jgi:two-component system OmpR family response regulator
MRILFIEDDLKIAGFINRGLKEAGFVFDHTQKGEEGLYFTRINDYDAAIINVKLDGLSSLSIVHRF